VKPEAKANEIPCIFREIAQVVRCLEFWARPDKAVDDAGGEGQHRTPLRVIFDDLLNERDAAGLLVERDRHGHASVHARGGAATP